MYLQGVPVDYTGLADHLAGEGEACQANDDERGAERKYSPHDTPWCAPKSSELGYAIIGIKERRGLSLHSLMRQLILAN